MRELAFNVLHPFVEAEIDKEGIRAMARGLGLTDISELPSAPCLSSRVTTGISIKTADLNTIERVEEMVREQLGNTTFRCRLSNEGFILEVAEDALESMEKLEISALTTVVKDELGLFEKLVGIRPYVRGSAFVEQGVIDGNS